MEKIEPIPMNAAMPSDDPTDHEIKPVLSDRSDTLVKRASETRFHTSRIKDSITVQSRHNYVNDDEKHEEHPHLQDFLVPHHSVHIETEEEKKEKEEAEKEGIKEREAKEEAHKPKLERPCRSILHKETCTSRIPCPKTEARRHVTFDSVIIRDYGMILGDHPCCSYGPPVTLDWDYLEYEPLKVDEYEFHHSLRRPLKQLNLNYFRRLKLLEMAGTSEEDLKTSKKDVSKIKRSRSVTRYFVSAQPVEAAVESAVRKFKRVLKDDHWKSERHLFK
uniref:Uncharacterized protein n=1 Tax=Ditylum brightwellii TaxID=49249 RepID=A0A7S4RZQ0_9STRA